MSTVNDATFWKRFSRAIHLSEEEAKAESEASESSSTSTLKGIVQQKRSDSWLEQQRKKRRRCKWICFVVSTVFIALTAGVVVLIWFAEHNIKGGSEYG